MYFLADVRPQALHFPVLLFSEAPDADMDALACVGELRFYLFPDEEILHLGILVQEVERTVDGVVIG